MMSLIDNKVSINCTGPYIWYMDVCYKSLTNVNVSGTLLLQVEVEVEGKKQKTTASSIILHTSGEDCRGLHSIVYLSVNEMASVEVSAGDEFKIKEATLGLSYLLSQCRQ